MQIIYPIAVTTISHGEENQEIKPPKKNLLAVWKLIRFHCAM